MIRCESCMHESVCKHALEANAVGNMIEEFIQKQVPTSLVKVEYDCKHFEWKNPMFV